MSPEDVVAPSYDKGAQPLRAWKRNDSLRREYRTTETLKKAEGTDHQTCSLALSLFQTFSSFSVPQ
jgi:hypothetical protein